MQHYNQLFFWRYFPVFMSAEPQPAVPSDTDQLVCLEVRMEAVTLWHLNQLTLNRVFCEGLEEILFSGPSAPEEISGGNVCGEETQNLYDGLWNAAAETLEQHLPEIHLQIVSK